jgi:hypothetical protein
MKSRLIVLAAGMLAVMPHVAVAQKARVTLASAAAEPPALPAHAFAQTSESDQVIAGLFAFQPAIPWGPVDVLKGYEDEMNFLAQSLSAELVRIAQANRTNQITRAEAEYLIQERYQVAMMQHEVLSALHESVQHDLDQAAKRLGSASQSDSAVVVQPALPGQIRIQ